MDFNILDGINTTANRWTKIELPDRVRHSITLQLETFGIFKYSFNVGENTSTMPAAFNMLYDIQPPMFKLNQNTISVLAEPLSIVTVECEDNIPITIQTDTNGAGSSYINSPVVGVSCRMGDLVSPTVIDETGINQCITYRTSGGVAIQGITFPHASIYLDNMVATADENGMFILVVPEVTFNYSISCVNERGIKFLRGLANTTVLYGNYSKKSIYINTQDDDIVLIGIQDSIL
jgi:hypothetical protein